MEKVPTEIIWLLGLYMPRFRDRAALCSVSRYLNRIATPLLYEHTIIELDNTYRPLSKPEHTPFWLRQLRALHKDRARLCPAIRKLSILFPDESDIFKRGVSLAMELLVSCAREMHALDEVVWCSNLVPSDELLRVFVEKKITAFTYDGDARVTSLSHPETMDFEILAQCPLRSLSIKSSLEIELVALRDAIYTLRKSLKSLAVRFGDWESRGHNQAGYPYCRPKSVNEEDGDPTRVLFGKFRKVREKIRLESLDALFTLSELSLDEEKFLEAVDTECLRRLRFSWNRLYRRSFLFPGDRQEYRSLESLTLDGQHVLDRAVPWDEFPETSSRLTFLSTYCFVNDAVDHFRSLRTLVITGIEFRDQQAISDLETICPLLEELAYYPSKQFTSKDLPSLEKLPYLRRLYALPSYSWLVAYPTCDEFLIFCQTTGSPLIDRLDRVSFLDVPYDIVSTTQLEWSLRTVFHTVEPSTSNGDAKLSVPLLPKGEDREKLTDKPMIIKSCRGKVLRRLDWWQIKRDPVVDAIKYW